MRENVVSSSRRIKTKCCGCSEEAEVASSLGEAVREAEKAFEALKNRQSLDVWRYGGRVF